MAVTFGKNWLILIFECIVLLCTQSLFWDTPPCLYDLLYPPGWIWYVNSTRASFISSLSSADLLKEEEWVFSISSLATFNKGQRWGKCFNRLFSTELFNSHLDNTASISHLSSNVKDAEVRDLQTVSVCLMSDPGNFFSLTVRSVHNDAPYIYHLY